MEELIKMVSERTGLAPEKAQEAVDTVFTFLKAKLPPSIGNHLDALASGNLGSITSSMGGLGGLADMAKKIENKLGFGEPNPNENRT